MFKELASQQKRLLTSFFLFSLASPMASIYSNTFLWRQDKDPITLGIFNIGTFIGVTIGFFLNALLLRLLPSGRLYALGCVLQGLVPLVLVLLGAQANSYAFILGLALGCSMGLFWGNRNTLTSKTSEGPNRYRFVSIETSMVLIAGVVAPFLVGWFITLGSSVSLLTIQGAYQLTSVLGLILLTISGTLLWSVETEPFTTKHFWIKHPSALWKSQRLLEVINGIADGLSSVLPLVIILIYLGQENAVGTVKGLAALLSGSVIYFIRNYVRHHHHTTLFGIWIAFNLTGAVIFSITQSAFGAMIFFVLGGLVASFRWSSFTSVMYEVVDQEMRSNKIHRFVYLLDRECFLNLGRVLGLGILIALYTQAPTLLVRYGLILTTLIPIPLLFLLQSITKRIGETAEQRDC